MSKILYVDGTNRWYSDGYNIEVLSENDKILAKAKIKDKYAKFAGCSLTRRLVRVEFTGLYKTRSGAFLVVGKKGIFRGEGGEQSATLNFEKVFATPRGSKPLNLCKLPNGHIFFGEYFQNMDKVAVNVYGSTDDGRSWKVVYTFEAGIINHIHGLFFDSFTKRMWIVTGDRENECIIGYTDDEFKSFHEVLRGGQEYRSCQLFFYPDFIVYATDSQYIENEIRAIDRKTLEITPLAKIQGSAIKGGQTGDVSYLATTIEPSDVNKDRFSHIWVTKDGWNWKDIFKAEKDSWPALFQFGTFEFPQNAFCNGKLYFSGRALKNYDNKSSDIEI